MLDRWILSELSVLISDCEKSFDGLNATKVGRDIQAFVVNNLSNWYVRLCRRRFWKSTYGPDKISAFQTLYDCLLAVSKISSPISPFYSDFLFKDLTFFKNEKNSVHLSSWPGDSFLEKDFDLVKKMRVIQSITSLGLSLRKKLKIKVRQPLSSVSIILNKTKEMSFEDEFLSILKTELNVKSVDFVTQSSSFVEKKLTPNFPVLGKKYKNLMKELVVSINNLNKEEISFFEKNNSLKLLLNEKELVLSEDDIIIKTSSVPGWSVASDREITVALDTKITDSLAKEGLAREFINRLQNLRKKHNYNVVDLVDVSVFCEEALSISFQKNLNYIMSEVLASELNFLKIKPNICEEVEINGSKVYIAIKLNPKNG